MLSIPQSTEYNKRIPKQKFYENLTLTPQVKRGFIDGIKLIYWRNKLAEDTVHIPKGERVTEIEVFEIKLSGPALDEAVLRQIDKEIPYHILFLLSFEDRVQAWIGYKEASAGVNSFKVSQYYHTEWMQEDELPLRLEGLTLDAVYENLVRQIAGGSLDSRCEYADVSLAEDIAREQKRRDLERRIAALEGKIRKEKQLNKQVMLNEALKEMRKEIELL